MSRVLVLSSVDDLHTKWVSAGLSQLGVDVTCFDMRQYPQPNRQTIRIDNGIHYSDVKNSGLTEHSPFDAVWVRRPGGANLTALNVHEDDIEFLVNVHDQYDHEIWSLINSSCTNESTLWINPSIGSSRASSKIIQYKAASAAGLTTVPTLISNDIAEIRRFFSEKGDLVCKSFIPKLWNDKGSFSKALTSVIDVNNDSLEDSIAIQPSMYQPLIEKKFELRILVLDEKVFAVKIDSQVSQDFKLDWRRRPLPKNMVSEFTIDKNLANKLLDVMSRLGICMGSFDFIVDTNDVFHFLEVNEAGQFLFLEQYCPTLPILDAFCYLLKNKTLSTWCSSTTQLKLSDIQEILES